MESEALPYYLPPCSPTPCNNQKERPNLSLDLESIDLRSDCQTATPGPSTAMILKKIEKVETDLKEIFPHITESNPHSVIDTLETHPHSPELTAVSNVSMQNLFDECFKKASSRGLRLDVSSSAMNKNESLETPSLNLVSPMKAPTFPNPKPANSQPSPTNNANARCDSSDQSNNKLMPRKRGRPRKPITEPLLNQHNGTISEDELKKLQYRERNRLAGINFRRNQKDWVREISNRVRSLEDKNATLEAQLSTAQKRISQLEIEIVQLVKSNSTKLVYKCLVPPVIVSGPSDSSTAQ